MSSKSGYQYIVETNNTFSGETAILSSYTDPKQAQRHADSVELITGTWVVVSKWKECPKKPRRIGTYYRRDF